MYHKIIRLNGNSGKMHASSISALLKNTKKKTSCDITLNLSKNKTYLKLKKISLSCILFT